MQLLQRLEVECAINLFVIARLYSDLFVCMQSRGNLMNWGHDDDIPRRRLMHKTFELLAMTFVNGCWFFKCRLQTGFLFTSVVADIRIAASCFLFVED